MTHRRPGPRVTAAAALALCALAVAVPVPSQAADEGKPTTPLLANVVPQDDEVTLQATIRSIDRNTREVALLGASGAQVRMTAGPAVRLEMLKPGDKVTAKYYRSVAFVVTTGGAKVPENQVKAIVARPAQAPGGIALRQTQISGLVVGIDLAAHTVDLVNPGGGLVYTVYVADPERQTRMSELKVGDTVTAIVTETLAVSINPA